MDEMERLKYTIEQARKELDDAIFVENFESYYEKSRQLDELIEEYIEKSQSRKK